MGFGYHGWGVSFSGFGLEIRNKGKDRQPNPVDASRDFHLQQKSLIPYICGPVVVGSAFRFLGSGFWVLGLAYGVEGVGVRFGVTGVGLRI